MPLGGKEKTTRCSALLDLITVKYNEGVITVSEQYTEVTGHDAMPRFKFYFLF